MHTSHGLGPRAPHLKVSIRNTNHGFDSGANDTYWDPNYQWGTQPSVMAAFDILHGCR